MTQEDKMIKIYYDATIIARQNSQTVGEKNNYYITLEQLHQLFADNQ